MTQLAYTAAQLHEFAAAILADLDALPPDQRARKLAFEIQGFIENQTDVVSQRMIYRLSVLGRNARSHSKVDGDPEMHRAIGIGDAELELESFRDTEEWRIGVLGLSKEESDRRERLRGTY
ncbi:MAG: hypothetical protein QHC81_01015 [Achromobacter sp.]|nr:hypothetical protein [Achromobacter sp.]